MNRRQFLCKTLKGTTALYFSSQLPVQAAVDRRQLSFFHLHTQEQLLVTYKQNGAYLPESLKEINCLLRDFRTGEVHPIDPKLLDLLYHLKQPFGNNATFKIISGYRSPGTNQMLRGKNGGVARKSQHMLGKAIDIRLSGVDTWEVRNRAMKIQRGGVGYYRRNDFVHLDTGRVRWW